MQNNREAEASHFIVISFPCAARHFQYANPDNSSCFATSHFVSGSLTRGQHPLANWRNARFCYTVERQPRFARGVERGRL